jgi:hypothetical protein
VEVQDKGIVTMNSLRIGDHIKTGITHHGQTEYSRIISLMHKDQYAELEYLQIFIDTSPLKPREISGIHFLYLHDNNVLSVLEKLNSVTRCRVMLPSWLLSLISRLSNAKACMHQRRRTK